MSIAKESLGDQGVWLVLRCDTIDCDTKPIGFPTFWSPELVRDASMFWYHDDARGHREALFRYFAHRARGQAWEAAFRSAASRFLGDDNDVFLVGLIVRDTPPEQADLASSARRLAKDCPASTCVHLAAVYLPPDTISGLEQMYLDANAEAA